MQLKNNARTVFDEGINEHISHKRVLQKLNPRSKCLTVNVPSRIAKEMDLKQRQFVVFKMSRDDQNKLIIVIEPTGDHKESKKRESKRTTAPKDDVAKENGTQSTLSVDLKDSVAPNESPV